MTGRGIGGETKMTLMGLSISGPKFFATVTIV